MYWVLKNVLLYDSMWLWQRCIYDLAFHLLSEMQSSCLESWWWYDQILKINFNFLQKFVFLFSLWNPHWSSLWRSNLYNLPVVLLAMVTLRLVPPLYGHALAALVWLVRPPLSSRVIPLPRTTPMHHDPSQNTHPREESGRWHQGCLSRRVSLVASAARHL